MSVRGARHRRDCHKSIKCLFFIATLLAVGVLVVNIYSSTQAVPLRTHARQLVHTQWQREPVEELVRHSERSREPTVDNLTEKLNIPTSTGGTRSVATALREDTVPSHSEEEGQGGLVSRTLTNIDRCMAASGLSSPSLLKQARQNAQLFAEQYRRVIPPRSLPGYTNHCWNTTYELSLKKNEFVGSIGEISFKGSGLRHWFGQNSKSFFQTQYGERFTSSTACVPNIFLLGFERCGTTHLWCLLSKLLNHNATVQSTKEPFFWAPYDYRPTAPSVRHLASLYLPIFLPSVDPTVSLEARKSMAAIDASPYTVQSWPRFSGKESDLANYCLLPSALPELLPGSKFIVIMRDPVEMMYSAFWWSVIRDRPRNKMGSRVALDRRKGPEAFHTRAEERITQFLQCVNSHPSVEGGEKCESASPNYSSCITSRAHLLSECVQNITTKREHIEAVLHRGLYYVHVRRWLQTITRKRIFFTTTERLSSDPHSVLREAVQFLRGERVSKEDIDSILSSCRKNHNPQYKKDPTLTLQSRTRQMLETFFEPFNKLLSELLEDEQFLWHRQTNTTQVT